MWDDLNLGQIWGEVWVTMHIEPPHPRTIAPPPRHQSQALGRQKPIPTIRSWLGGSGFRSSSNHTPHTLTR